MHIDQARTWKKKNRKQLEKIRWTHDLSAKINQVHKEVFQHINCLDCANCCKTTGPRFTPADIDRIARFEKLSNAEFFESYLRIDEDGDTVLKKVPCTFLMPDHSCRIYEVRPKACRQYPHTDTPGQNQIFDLTLKNAEICPGVFEMLKKILV